MKKILSLMLALVLCLALCACGGNGQAEVSADTDTAENTETAENPYTDMEFCAEYAIDKLKSILKNPNSLAVNNLYAVETDDCYIFAIDYSAENGFGGTNRDEFFLSVNSVENGFAVRTYGTGAFSEAENQNYTSQAFTKANKASGAYILDPETFEVIGMDESGVDSTLDQRVKLVGKLKGEKKDSTGFGGAWDFELEGDSLLKVVYFTEGTDLSWYAQFTGKPYEITISAVKESDSVYREAEIVEDPILDVTDDQRLARFNYYDRAYYGYQAASMTPMSGDAIEALLADTTFSMRNNYGGDGDGTHTITFHADGTLDATYMGYDGKEYSMYQSWRMENGSVVCTNSFTNLNGEAKTVDVSFTPYQFDETRYLLIDAVGEKSDKAMVLTTLEG